MADGARPVIAALLGVGVVTGYEHGDEHAVVGDFPDGVLREGRGWGPIGPRAFDAEERAMLRNILLG